MFQCIIQPKSSIWVGNRQELKEVFPDLRQQLQDQLKCLDTRLETQLLLSNELQDFFRKKSEIELEYSRSLDKLAKSLLLRQKELKQRREQLHLFSLYNCWQELINTTKKESHERSALAEIYNSHITTRFSMIMDDLQRIYKQCREIGTDSHEELLKVLHELHTSTKTYHLYQTEHRQTETKLKIVESQKKKLELVIPKEKIEKSKKIKLVDKEIQKRRNKYNDARFKALKAKNEYILCMDAANAAVQKYFVDDLSDMIDCMDLGFYQCASRGLNMYTATQEHVRNAIGTNSNIISKCTTSLDSRLDKQKFLEANNSCFIMPKKFEFQPLKGDELQQQQIDVGETNGSCTTNTSFTNSPTNTSAIGELETVGFIRQELEQRLIQLYRRLDSLRIEAEESWKTLETAETSLIQLLTVNDYDVDEYFIDSTSHRPSLKPDYLVTSQRLRAETDEFHLNKFRDYMLGTNRIARLQAKYDHIRKILGEIDPNTLSPGLAQTLAEPRKIVKRKRIGQLQNMLNPRLFGGSLEEYIDSTNQEIPVVLKSCIRVINLYGLHHQGIFRVSGSQIEINNFKDAFERGEDPLIDINDASDINSIAGVLKLYLRELREPLFPIVYFEQFMELAQLESKNIFVTKIRDLFRSLTRPVYIVLRYLFAFLNHLSEYSDENMMDPYNIAICFGPTLVPVPEDKDQVQYQNLVNELIKNVIIYMEDIFTNDEDIGGIRYEKYISKEPEEVDMDTPGDNPHEDMESEILCPSEDDSVFVKERDISLQVFQKSEYLEGIAQYDFNARSDREISFKKGDSITLYSQVSSDWWKGSCNGLNGLIPDKYIMLKIKDEEHRERLSSSPYLLEKKMSNPMFQHHHSRTASDSFLTTRSLPSQSPSFQLGKLTLTSKTSSSGDSVNSSPMITNPSSTSSEHKGTGQVLSTSISSTESMENPNGIKHLPKISESRISSSSNQSEASFVKDSHALIEQETPEHCPGDFKLGPTGIHPPTSNNSVHLITKSQLDESIETRITDSDEGSEGESLTILPTVSSKPTTSLNDAKTINEIDEINQKEEDSILGSSSFPPPPPNEEQSFTFHLHHPSTGISLVTKSKVGSTSIDNGTNQTTNQPKMKVLSQFWESKSVSKNVGVGQQQSSSIAATPDLVMDLPMISSSTLPDDTIDSPDSGSESTTAAETFARQNQSTLKKNYKNPISGKDNEKPSTSNMNASNVSALGQSSSQMSNSNPTSGAFKPQVKVKPIVLKKPTIPFHLLSSNTSSTVNDGSKFVEEDESSKNDDEKTTNL